MSERWVDIPGFPEYEISDHGRVYSKYSGHDLSLSMNTRGHIKVNLSLEGEIHTRSVRVLVANAFVEVPDRLRIETHDLDVINLDGNPENNNWENLAWRPRWFSWKYTRQFNQPVPAEYNVNLLNTLTGEVFTSVMDAGVAHGELWEYVYASAIDGRPVYPSGAVYEFLSLGTLSQIKQGI